jgi:hypothetical protein
MPDKEVSPESQNRANTEGLSRNLRDLVISSFNNFRNWGNAGDNKYPG